VVEKGHGRVEQEVSFEVAHGGIIRDAGAIRPRRSVDECSAKVSVTFARIPCNGLNAMAQSRKGLKSWRLGVFALKSPTVLRHTLCRYSQGARLISCYTPAS
jgi:hypothetical protein